MSTLPFSFFKQGNQTYEVVDKAARQGVSSERFRNKKVVVIGDSLSVDNTTWIEPFKTLVTGVGGTVTNLSAGGATSSSALSAVNNLSSSFDIAMIWLGVNDAYGSKEIGDKVTANSFSYNIQQIISKLMALNPAMDIYVFSITYAGNCTYYKNKSTFSYNAALHSIATQCGCVFKNIDHIIRADISNTNAMESDHVHFKETYSKSTLFEIFVSAMQTFVSDDYIETIVSPASALTPATGVVINSAQIANIVGSVALARITFTVSTAPAAGVAVITLPSVLKCSSTAVSIAVRDINSGTAYYGMLADDTIKFGLSLPSGTYYTEFFFCPLGNNNLQYL